MKEKTLRHNLGTILSEKKFLRFLGVIGYNEKQATRMGYYLSHLGISDT